MITLRRAFQAKVGAAGTVMTRMKELQSMLEAQDGPVTRITPTC